MKSKILLVLLAVAIGIWGRLIPHWPNFTPTISLCLLSVAWFSRPVALFVTAMTILLSDAALSVLYHYPWLGSWSIFVYSGYGMTLFLGRYLSSNLKIISALSLTGLAAFVFWLWTNFGTWLLAGLYPKTGLGLVECYIAALPFLYSALLGGILWTTLLLAGSSFFGNLIPTLFRGRSAVRI